MELTRLTLEWLENILGYLLWFVMPEEDHLMLDAALRYGVEVVEEMAELVALEHGVE